jgi:hypothetical protein
LHWSFCNDGFAANYNKVSTLFILVAVVNSGVGNTRSNNQKILGLVGGITTYAYVGGNPVNLVDPLGLFDFGEYANQVVTGQILEQNIKNYNQALDNAVNGNPSALNDLLINSLPIGAIGKVGKSVTSLGSCPTYLYQKVGALGEHLKFGVTKNPSTRYTADELAGGQLKIIAEGPRSEMLQLERNLHETLPIGPEEGQQFYILLQIEKGLKPPPY